MNAKERCSAPRASWEPQAGERRPARPHPVLELQAAVGNRALARALTLGPRGDACEREADAVAAEFLTAAEPASTVSPRGETAPAAASVQRASSGDSAGVDADVQAGIEGARGHGAALPAAVRAPFEHRLGADLSGVRLHTDARAANLARSLRAVAFTTGKDVFFGAGHYAPQTPRGRGLLAHELTHVVQQHAAEPLVQRAVGFEFETGYAVREVQKGRFRTKRRRLPKASILHAYQGFNLTADETSTDVGAALEWVVDPPVSEAAGIQVLDDIMIRLVGMASRIEALHGRDSFTLDQATGDARDAWLEILPKTISGAGPGMPANPQVTGGVRLEQMQTLFKELGNPSGRNQQIQQDLHTVGAGLMANAAQAVDGINGSDRLKGLVAQIVAYLRAGSLLGMPASPGQAFNYAKLIGKIMARTDFGAQFELLPAAELATYRNNPNQFVALALSAAGNLQGDVSVFERKVRKEPKRKPTAWDDVFDFPVKRKDWLIGITRGRDLLSSKHMPHWKSELEGLGALGSKTDVVGRSQDPGVVVEFRGARTGMPLNVWRTFALGAYSYIVELNRRNSPEEDQAETAANFAELPSGY